MAQRVLSAAYKELGIDVAFTPLPIRRGYAQAEAGEVDGLGMTVTLELAPNLEALFRKLALGRTDVVVESRFNGCLVKQLGLQKAVLLQPSLEVLPAYHFLHSRHAALVPRITAVLRKMESDGSIKKIQATALREYLAQCG
jgi:ABC-type amino acid transport substrate-binding protein